MASQNTLFNSRELNDMQTNASSESVQNLGPGIHEGVRIVEIKRADAGTGEYWDIRFLSNEGLGFRKRIFDPKVPMKLMDGETPEEGLTRSIRDTLTHFTHLYYIVNGEGAADVKATTYEEFVGKIIRSVEPRLKNIKFNLKLILDRENKEKPGTYYTGTNRTPKNYLELHVPGEPSKLQMFKSELAKIAGEGASDTAKAPTPNDLPF